jgi:hypothetical protein
MNRFWRYPILIFLVGGLAGFALSRWFENPAGNAAYTPVMATYSPLTTNTPTSLLIATRTVTFIMTATFDKSVSPSATPSPSITPTLDYAAEAKIYLQTPTPYPTRPSQTPAPTPLDPLRQVVAHKLPPEWTPVPYQLVESYYDDPHSLNWKMQIIQTTTDLMNWVDADPIQFARQVKALQPKGVWFGDKFEWLLKDDFDGDRQPEWLVSIPAYSADKEIQSYPEQMVILFERTAGVYKPVAYQRPLSDGRFLHGEFAKVLLVQDLNRNGLKEIGLRSMSCGTACSEAITMGEWDGKAWHYTFWESLPGSFSNYFMFTDVDRDGSIEMTLHYTTFYYLDQRYPQREASDTYGWRDGRWKLLDEWRSPSANSYAILRDMYSALELGKTQEALEAGLPVLHGLSTSCDIDEVYTGIEVMLAQTLLNAPQAAQATLQQLDMYCQIPENGYLDAAHIYMQAYQQTGEAVTSCTAMNRFMFQNKLYNPVLNLYQCTNEGCYYNYCPISPIDR